MTEVVPCPACLAKYGPDGYLPKEGSRECESCGGRGTWVVKKTLWCQCPEREPGPDDDDEDGPSAIYHKNGRAIWESCVPKHHWHCGACKGLVQIG